MVIAVTFKFVIGSVYERDPPDIFSLSSLFLSKTLLSDCESDETLFCRSPTVTSSFSALARSDVNQIL